MIYNKIIFNDEIEFDSPQDKEKYEKKQLKKQKFLKESEEAKVITSKFLEENPHVNIAHVITHLQSMILSTTKAAEKLGISPSAFSRLRKKYNISPVYTVANKPGPNSKLNKAFPPNAPKFAIRNFYSPAQLKLINESDIELVQLRAARSLKYPNGKGSPWKWTKRGYHPNGKLKARTDNLRKYKIPFIYDPVANKYQVKVKNYEILTRQEVDKLNFQYGKLKVFV